MKQYHDLLRSILDNGSEHRDRTGVGTISHFGFHTRFNLREGFPIVTTKRVPFRWVAEELFWFLSGDTSETNLRARGVDIWAEWADEAHMCVVPAPPVLHKAINTAASLTLTASQYRFWSDLNLTTTVAAVRTASGREFPEQFSLLMSADQ